MEIYEKPMFKEPILKDQTIIVTGGGTGLGKAMASYFSELGACVVITGRREQVLQNTAEEIASATGGKVLPLPGDVREIEDVRHVLTKSVETFGSVTGLVNNAAGNFVSPTERLSHRAFKAVIEIVLQGSIHFSLECGKYWIDKGVGGTILNIVTTYAWTGTGYTVPSACAKAGVLAMTRSLAVEWGRKYGIRVNAIAPGPFPTKGAWSRLLPGEAAERFDPAQRVPLQRVGEKQELANLAAYLMSEFAGYINGEVVTIDGGEWLENGGQFNAFRHVSDDVWDALAKARGKG